MHANLKQVNQSSSAGYRRSKSYPGKAGTPGGQLVIGGNFYLPNVCDFFPQTTASDTQDHTVENLIRMGLAGLVLIILGTLLFEHWRNQSWTYHEAGK